MDKNSKTYRVLQTTALLSLMFVFLAFIAFFAQNVTSANSQELQNLYKEKIEVEMELQKNLLNLKDTEKTLENFKIKSEELREKRKLLEAKVNSIINPDFQPEIEEKK